MTTLQTHPAAEIAPQRVWRVEVHPLHETDDPRAASLAHEVADLHLAPSLTKVTSARVYLIQGPFDEATIRRIASELLTDPIDQRYTLGATPATDGASLIEVHYLPGVMDPVALSAQDAIAEMTGGGKCQVRTGFRYDLSGIDGATAQTIASRLLANAVIQSVSFEPQCPEHFIEGRPYEMTLTHVPIRDLDDAALVKMSREAHLFLSLTEMQAIRQYYRDAGREPTDVELETLAQTWSEHCVHKTLKSRIRYVESSDMAMPGRSAWTNRPGHTIDADGALIIDNLLKSTIAAATNKLIADGLNWCISVFVDNAGIIRFDDEHAVTFKVETHNHPSAIEPYGGAATGIGGCIRDTMGTGLAAKPIANTDIFAVADPNTPPESLPKGVLHPRRVLKQVVAGVRDYGNRMGIPTVNGAVAFDDRYLGNPLVFAGSVGLIPNDKCFGSAKAGDRIIVLGGRTGRDGIHGATFSSAELTDTHADEFSHAVQIGNAITEKKTLDVILQARDHAGGCLYNAITDCGAGGFSSAVGEMGEKLGAHVQLEKAPLKYDGLSYTEIWISEAQERMVMAVSPDKVATLAALCEAEDVEICDLGEFGTDNAELVLTYRGTEVGRLAMHLLHEGIPQPVREAAWECGVGRSECGVKTSAPSHSTLHTPHSALRKTLISLLANPNIASKHWVIRQYDHEVQAGSVVKPLTGPQMDGPSDAAVLRPKLTSQRGIALSCGLQSALGDVDPYWMTLAAIDEAVRNAVCVGARPDRVAILDNFCWADCSKPANLGSLVRAAEACYDGALAYRTPFISGKDSLNNQFTTDEGKTIAIPPTLLISAIGIVDDVNNCVTMDAKTPGNMLILVGVTTPQMGASAACGLATSDIPRVDLTTAPKVLAAVADLIGAGFVRSAHDCSEGGLLVAATEMAFAGRLGLDLNLAGVPRPRNGDLSDFAACFAETPTRVLLEIEPDRFDALARKLRAANIPFGHVGTFNDGNRLVVRDDQSKIAAEWTNDEMLDTWLKPLDW
ncbi:MAG: phosphoribosylformylglycinamidine synthase subunit PurL [Planctomycetes bacterium]|nr:phosphoribosylformylglycinamidine synthase subunit PurL [Planctomycetota bacterium]